MASTAKITLPFNRMAIEAAGADGDKAVEYSVVGERGLKLVCLPSGSASFMYAYAVGKGAMRRRNKIKIGNRDEISLTDARARADELRHKVGMGIDPAAEATKAQAAAAKRKAAITLADLWAERHTAYSDEAGH